MLPKVISGPDFSFCSGDGILLTCFHLVLGCHSRVFTCTALYLMVFGSKFGFMLENACKNGVSIEASCKCSCENGLQLMKPFPQVLLTCCDQMSAFVAPTSIPDLPGSCGQNFKGRFCIFLSSYNFYFEKFPTFRKIERIVVQRAPIYLTS